MVKAFQIFRNNGGTECLWVVGGQFGFTPSDLERKSLISSLGIDAFVEFKGVVTSPSELATLYRHAKMLVFPSMYETFGMVGVEAMACGCPVIASRMPAMPEILGEAAEYFDPYDPKEIAEKIHRVSTDEGLRKSMILKGKEWIKRYTWKKSAKELIHLMEEVVKNKR